jgi:two-component system, NarL family, response regulator DesR
MITVMLAEDQGLVRGALSALLGLTGDIRVVGSFPDGMSAWEGLQQHCPDVVVADIEMPALSGLELAARIRESGLPTKVVIVTTFARAGYLRRALDCGVLGYVLKDSPADQLADAIRAVHGGRRVIDPQLATEPFAESDPLNERERQLLRLSGEGLSASEIADRVCLSHGTVRNYLSEAIAKLGARNRIDAYQTARQRGWL